MLRWQFILILSFEVFNKSCMAVVRSVVARAEVCVEAQGEQPCDVLQLDQRWPVPRSGAVQWPHLHQE